MYIRYKCIRGKKKVHTYAYKVKSKWVKAKRAARQEVIEYLGKVEGMEPFEVGKVFLRDDFKCKSCGAEEDLTIDHIVPLCNKGTNDIDNLQTLCRKCNQMKGKN